MATAVTSLWVHAASSLCADGDGEAHRAATILTAHAQKDADRLFGTSRALPDYRQLGRLITAAARWCENADLATPLDIPPLPQPESLAEAARRVAAQNRPPGMVYRGVFIDGAKAVLVDEPDGSQRLLRDGELRARGEFTWGYHGNGPDDLAEALITDILAPMPAARRASELRPAERTSCTATRVMTPACARTSKRQP